MESDPTRYLKTAPLSSPCIRHCCLDQNDICLGCFRSLEEIKAWQLVDNQTRRQFLQNAKQRKLRYQQKGETNL